MFGKSFAQADRAQRESAVRVGLAEAVHRAVLNRMVAFDCGSQPVQLAPVLTGQRDANGAVVNTSIGGDEAKPVRLDFGVYAVKEMGVMVVLPVAVAPNDPAPVQEVENSLAVDREPRCYTLGALALFVESARFVLFGLRELVRFGHDPATAENIPHGLAAYREFFTKLCGGFTGLVTTAYLGLLRVRKAAAIRAGLAVHVVIVDVLAWIALTNAALGESTGSYRGGLAATAMAKAIGGVGDDGTQSARRSRGGTSRASAILRSVRGCGLSTVPCSILRMVAGLTLAMLASSRCERDRSSRIRLTFAPVVSFTTIIVANFVSFRRNFATGTLYRILRRFSTNLLQNECDYSKLPP